MRRALVIKQYGDPDIAGAIVDGMARHIEPLNTEELMAMNRELQRLRMRQELRRYRDERTWLETKAELQRKYGTKPHGPLYDNALAAYVIGVMVLEECWRRLMKWLRARRRRHDTAAYDVYPW